ncbi:alpha/beta fold hydrolase [Streptomyces koyangensis]|uniref:alpha/beta hydrolase n=1 Tax=Streptomyces koyangensis TaxID=188770 RepID=UPI003BF4A0D6
MSGASSNSQSVSEPRRPVHATVWDDRPDSTANEPRWPVVLVHGILTWGDDPRYGFAAQRPLAARRRLLLMDRRGYGRSPDIARSDWGVDAEDIVGLLGTGAHLVGHAYGGVGAMAAAVRRPDLVRSLTLIQPGALRPAERHPVVAEALVRARAATAALPPDLTPAEFLRGATESVGMETPEATPERLRAAATTMAELPCWDADIALAPLARAAFPKLLVSGDWEGAPEPYRTYAGLPLIACAEEIAEAAGAAHLVVPGYYPHTQQPERVNTALEHLWDAADQG